MNERGGLRCPADENRGAPQVTRWGWWQLFAGIDLQSLAPWAPFRHLDGVLELEHFWAALLVPN